MPGCQFWNWVKAGVVGVGSSHISYTEGFVQDGFTWYRKLRVEPKVQNLGQPTRGDKGRVNTATGEATCRWTPMEIYYGFPYY